jgi:hypothetical protein
MGGERLYCALAKAAVATIGNATAAPIAADRAGFETSPICEATESVWSRRFQRAWTAAGMPLTNCSP